MQQNELVESAFEIEFGKVTKISESNYASTEFEAKRTSRASTKISSSVTHHCRQDIYFTETDTNHEKHISLKDWRVAMKEGDKVAFAFLKGWRRRKIVAVFNYNLRKHFYQPPKVARWFWAIFYGFIVSIIPAINILGAALLLLDTVSLLLLPSRRGLMVYAGAAGLILTEIIFLALSVYVTFNIASLPLAVMIANCIAAISIFRLFGRLDKNVRHAVFEYIEQHMASATV